MAFEATAGPSPNFFTTAPIFIFAFSECIDTVDHVLVVYIFFDQCLLCQKASRFNNERLEPAIGRARHRAQISRRARRISSVRRGIADARDERVGQANGERAWATGGRAEGFEASLLKSTRAA